MGHEPILEAEAVEPRMPGQQVADDGELHIALPETTEAPASNQAARLLGKYASIAQVIYKNGVKHVYGVDEAGKKQHLSHDAVLDHYGHVGERRNKARFDEIRRNLGLPIHSEPAKETHAASNDTNRDKAIFGPAGALADFRNGLRTKLAGEGRRFKRARDGLRKLSLLGGVIFENGAKHVAERVEKFYRNPETSKRKKIFITAVGAVALGAVGFGIYELTQLGGAAPPGRMGGGEFPSPKPHIPYHPHHHPHHAPVHHAPKIAEVASLPKYNPQTGAGTVWESVQRYAGRLGYKHLTDHQIYQLTGATLRANHLTWEQARDLPVGFSVHELRPHEVEKLLKAR